MRGEISRDILRRNFERGEVRLRARPEIHDELVAIAELDQPRAIGLTAADEWPPGSERDDAHFVGGERFGIGKVVVALARHMVPMSRPVSAAFGWRGHFR